MSVVIHMTKPKVTFVGEEWPELPKPGSGSWEGVREAVNWLLVNEEYWSSYLGEFSRIITRDVDTAAVCCVNGELQMLINPDYMCWDMLDTMALKAGPLVHEMLHPAMGHLAAGPPPGDLGNICADLSVNGTMDPRMRAKWHLQAESFEVDGVPLPRGRGWKFYWDKLVHTEVLELDGLQGLMSSGLEGPGGGQDALTPFDLKGRNGTDPGQVVTHASHEALKGAAAKISPHSVPDIIQKMINIKFTQEPPPWDSMLASSCRSILSRGGKRTLAKRGRRSRRPPGQEKSGEKTVLWGLDTSGSMSDEDCLKTQVVMDGLRKKDGVKVLSQQFDADLQGDLVEVDKFKRLPTSFTGRGGTDFRPIIELARKVKPDLLVLATDGYAPTPPKPPCPTVWVFTPQCKSDHEFGKKIFIRNKVKADENEW